jgi:hypothetical protein
MEQTEDEPELQMELVETSDMEDENEALYKWLTIAVFTIWIASFLMF